jgi:hypothetical protein
MPWSVEKRLPQNATNYASKSASICTTKSTTICTTVAQLGDGPAGLADTAGVVHLKSPPQADKIRSSMPPEDPAEPPISDLERARRIKAVDYAGGMSKLSGDTFSPEIEQLNQQYIAGLISSQEYSAAIRQIVRLH